MIDITDFVKPGDRIILSHAAAEPQTLVELLIENKERLKGIEIFQGYSLNEKLSPDLCKYFRFKSLGKLGVLAKFVREENFEVMPCHLFDLPGFINQGILKFDVALIQVSPPDEDGYCSFGVSTDYPLVALRNARVKIAEINDQMPITLGTEDCFTHKSSFTALINTSRPLISSAFPQVGEVERKIGQYVAGLIPDGATIEIGIGAVCEATLQSLMDKKDLGVHSGMITDGVVDLVEGGAINNSQKTINKEKIVTGVLVGTDKLYRFAHNNPMLEMHPISYTHDVRVIQKIDNFIAINSAIEIDLTGQINSEIAGDVHVGAVGGVNSFVRGAASSRGGKSIFILPSTARKDTISRIVPKTSKGVVTIPRSDVQYIITEYGMANLLGKSLKERAYELINIAHPKFRDWLRSNVT